MIELSKIRIDGGTQPRAELNQDTVAEYAELYKATPSTMPPVTLFFDGAVYWLADGFHRYFGAKAAGKDRIAEEVTPGTLRDAILFSLSANSRHGLKRSNADKRKAVQTLLDDDEWSKWSDHELARRCAVSVSFVGDLRKAICSQTTDSQQPDTRTVRRNGMTYQQNTANVGKKRCDDKPSSSTANQPEHPASPAEEPPPEYTPLDQAMDTVRDLQDALALANAGDLSEEDKTQAADLIARLREENRILTLKLRAVTASRDQYQTENGELKRQITRQRREIDKLAGTKTA